MRATFLETGTSEVRRYADSLERLKYGPVTHLRYDVPGLSDSELLRKVAETKPDFICYIGQRWGQTPSTSCLTRMSTIAPTMHLCSDAGDTPWHDMLRQYQESGCFTVQVAIDGSVKWPYAAQNITALTPVDDADFTIPPRIHAERNVGATFAGNAGGGDNSVRTQTLVALLQTNTIEVRTRSPLPFTYRGYCDYLANCRISLNIANTGTEQSLHVKGRVLESGLAGCCLLETKGAPTSKWFTPGTDYLEYSSVAEAKEMIDELRDKPQATQSYGDALRAKIMASHTPEKFWGRVFDRIGLTVGEKEDETTRRTAGQSG